MWREPVVTIIDVINKKKESYRFPPIVKVFKYIQVDDIESQELFCNFPKGYPKFEELNGAPMGVLGQKIVFNNDRKFLRTVYVRFDDSGHDKTDIHINIDLLTRDENTGRHKVHRLGTCHFLKIEERGIQPFHVTISVPGKVITQPIIVLPSKEDLKYHKEERIFFDKLKKGILTKEDKIKHKKAFDNYVAFLKKNGLMHYQRKQ